MQVPEWFLRELKIFDPDLRVRWSAKQELWQLERRVRNALHPGTVRNDGWHDDYIRAQDGYLLVATIPPHGFGPHIFERLRDSDLWSQGGWKKIADQLDELEATAEEKRAANQQDDNEHVAREIWRLWAHRDGRSVYNGGFPGVTA